MIRAGAAAGRATAGLVLMHGRGSRAEEILGLLAHVVLPDLAVIAPQAPGGTWWPTSFLAPAATMAPYVAHAVGAVEQALRTLEAEGLPRGRLFLAGFSQGACLALESFARIGAGLGGVLAFSGGLLGTADHGDPSPALHGHADKRFTYPGRRDGASAWLSVTTQDPHIPLKRVEDSARVLAAMGARVETHVVPGSGHGVFREDLAALQRLLA